MDQHDQPVFRASGGALGALIRSHDWSASPLGGAAGWPVALRTMLELILDARQPMFIAWGTDRILLYNDAYSAMLGAKHPSALGGRLLEVWAEARETLSPMIDRVFAGEPIQMDDLAIVIDRTGLDHLEEAHFAFSYTPIRQADGTVAGLFCACTDITDAVRLTRHRAFQLGLADELRSLTEPRAIIAASAAALGRHLRASPVGYAELQPDGGVLLPKADDPDAPMAPTGPALLRWLGAERIGRQQQGLTVVETDLGCGSTDDPAPEAAIPARALVSVPLVRDGRLKAALYVGDRHPRRWTPDEVVLIEDVARRSWDAVERVQAEIALRDSEAYVRLLLDSTAEGFYAVDRDGRTTLCNPAFLQMLGFASEADAIGRRLHDVIHHSHPDGSPYCVAGCPIYVCARDGIAAHVTGELFYRLDGSALPVEYWARPILRDGELQGAICNFLDVTERTRAEQALRDESRTLELLNRTGASLAGKLDLEHVVQAVTDAGVALVGAAFGAFFYNVLNETGESYRLCTLSGVERSAFEQFPMPRNTDLFEPTFRGDGVVRSDDILADDRYGRNRPYSGMPPGHLPVRSYLAVPVTSRSGEVLGGLFFGHPEPGRFNVRHERLMTGVAAQAAISIDNARLFQSARSELDERRQAEARLHELNETLESRIAVALAEQADIQEALRQSQKMEAVGQLTGGLAHDFNNLLTGIAGSLELLSTRIGQGRISELDRYVDAAQGAARRAAALTHRLLAFSRRQTLDPRPTDVNRLVADMEELIRRTVGPGVALEVVGAAGLWSALVDPNQLENALLNLCINARDAMPDGGRLTIETTNEWLDERAARDRELPPGHYLSLCVTDTGTGMTPEVIARAFDPFFTTKPIGLGTGLGLSMIYGFARQSNGQVRICSELGRGTTMCLYLPRHLGGEDVTDTADEPEHAPRAEQGQTVLVVDDEPTVRMLVREILENLGYTAIEAVDGAAALKVLRSDVRLDLLVTDVGLPGGMNGRQVADAGRAIRQDLKVLFITGYAENAALSHGHLEHGMQVLTKPFSMEALASRITELIVGA